MNDNQTGASVNAAGGLTEARDMEPTGVEREVQWGVRDGKAVRAYADEAAARRVAAGRPDLT